MPAFTTRDARLRLAKYLEYADSIPDSVLQAAWNSVFTDDYAIIRDGKLIYNESQNGDVGVQRETVPALQGHTDETVLARRLGHDREVLSDVRQGV